MYDAYLKLQGEKSKSLKTNYFLQTADYIV